MVNVLGNKLGLVDLARRAKQQTGKGLLSQLTDIVSLRFGRWRLGPSEYYDYRLYDDELFTKEQKLEFIGWRGQQLVAEIMIDESFRGLSLDKLTFYSLMKFHGLPTPEFYAVYHRGGRRYPGCPTLTSEDELGTFLREKMTYPFYGKSSHGIYGRTNCLIQSYDAKDDCLIHPNGEREPVDDFVRTIPNIRRLGFMFQRLLKSHPDIEKACGSRIAGVRFIVFVDHHQVMPFRALWKVIVGDNITDNFQHGGSGNLLTALDVETGTVKRVIRGKGPAQDLLEVHPESGEKLLGFQVPKWQELVDVVTRGATVLPGISIQGWDVAVTDEGPVLLEVNLMGDMDLPQLAYRQGYGDKTFHDFVRSMGMEKHLYDWSIIPLKNEVRARTLRLYSGHLLGPH